MANIAVNTYCNLKCPYCFADNMIQDEKHTNITIRQLQAILLWLARSNKRDVGIIGGEPTLHPEFDKILKEIDQYTSELQCRATIFTNAICLEKYIDQIGDNVGLLINLNNPNNMTSSQWSNIYSAVSQISKLGWFGLEKNKACIGCNLYLEESNYDWIWDMLKLTNSCTIRTSVTAPGGKYLSWANHKDEYYNTMKPIFLKFCENAKRYNVKLGADCNQIPRCYFSAQEFELVTEVMFNHRNDICKPVVDITPDFRATACFGAYDPIDCSQFKNLSDLENYLLFKKTYPRVEANCSGKCSTCQKHEQLVCQGGCLGFANIGG